MTRLDSRSSLLASVTTLSLYIFLPVVALAADKSVEVLVDAGFTPTKTIGLLVSSSGTIQKKETKVTRRDNTTIIVSFSADDSELKEDTMATAIVVGEQGEQAWGEVAPVHFQKGEQPWWNMEACPKDKFAIGVIQDESALESLVQIRVARRKIFQAKLARELEDGLADSIATTEEFFGLKRDVPVGPDLSPDKLSDRFSRLTAALKSYRKAKEREKAAAEPVVEPEVTESVTETEH